MILQIPRPLLEASLHSLGRDTRKLISGKFDEAENIFHRVFLGMCHVLGKTNEDTVKVAYTLADLYADSDRIGQAIGVWSRTILPRTVVRKARPNKISCT